MTVVTANGCPHYLTVEVEGLGSRGGVMTHIEDKVGSIQAEEEAKLVFENVLSSVTDVRLARVVCY